MFPIIRAFQPGGQMNRVVRSDYKKPQVKQGMPIGSQQNSTIHSVGVAAPVRADVRRLKNAQDPASGNRTGSVVRLDQRFPEL